MDGGGPMSQLINTIERAFQLAEQSATLDEIRAKLKREGHFFVDAHLGGKKIRRPQESNQSPCLVVGRQLASSQSAVTVERNRI